MKAKKIFYCTDCGNETVRWAGQCPACGAWNTIVEQPEKQTRRTEVHSGGIRPRKARPIS
ncbi:MAG: DNA repair protein RadA, partial [Oscillibacter sp.]|nr:DNA repair protein RadA [Oscillibacter sp.]